MATDIPIAKSEQEYYQKERERELWEVEHFPEGEKTELMEIYRQQGYTDEEAHQLVEIKSRDRQRWVDAMMIDELGLFKDGAKSHGLTVWRHLYHSRSRLSPLLVYLAGLIAVIPQHVAFPISFFLSGLALFG